MASSRVSSAMRRMRAAAETLYIGRIGRGGAGLLGVGPGLLICI